ncbi:MAG: hypothetical protein PVSMB4_13820 [Ktedonobacterales bacterium]
MDQGEPAGLHALLGMCGAYMSAADLALVQTAYTVAAQAHRGVLRVSGEPFIEHPLAVARILASLAIDAAGIAAALLHDTVEDTHYTLDEIKARFGPDIAEIVDGVTKFSLVELAEPGSGTTAPGDGRPTSEQRARLQQETVRKLMLAMLRDPRVVLLKLADRLHNLRTLASMSAAQRAVKARETLEIYAPLAGRIGMQLIKAELEDLAFFYLQPEEFARVNRLLEKEAHSRQAWAERVCEHVKRQLAEDGISAAVNWRLKRPYRAYLETQQSGIREEMLHDVIAFRVLVNTQPECYAALGRIHHLWHHLDRIRDYIANPKVNGYRSLHTAVLALDHRVALFHIRTHEVHRWVQHGVASHWLERAARGEPLDGATRLALDGLSAWVAQLDSWHRDLRLSADDFVNALKSDVFEDQIFVFTPKGHIQDLPAASTPLDFAYRIHTALGDHFAGARVQTRGPDGTPLAREVSVDYALKTGDVVQILTDPNAHPRYEWLAHLRTRSAREKLMRALRPREGTEHGHLPDEPSAETEPDIPGPLLHPSGKPALVRLGRCCYPCPGDEIVGVPGRGRLVTIHRDCCRVLRRTLAKRQQGAALRVDWRAISPATYRAAIAVYGQDHAGFMHELAECARGQGINLTGSSAQAIQDRNKAIVTLICAFPLNARPEAFFRRLRTLPGVTWVERNTQIGCIEPQAGA